MKQTPHIIVIGAGIGGLTTAALLLKKGLRVTVLEANVYPGGSAGTFFHKGYRFDAGATLAGGFLNNGPHQRMSDMLGLQFPVEPADPAWITHLPQGEIRQWRDQNAWKEERSRQFPGSEPFWQKQETLAEIAWQLSQRYFPFPPQSASDLIQLATAFRPNLLLAAPYAIRSVAGMNPGIVRGKLKHFIDAQLMISAQTTSHKANAIYGSAALDLPRRGVVHVHGGIGEIANTLVSWIQKNGGDVLFRQQVEKLIIENNRAVAIETNKGLHLSGDYFIANLTPWGLVKIIPGNRPDRLQSEFRNRKPTWGAFMLYLAVQTDQLPVMTALHHQVIVDPERALGDGNSIFISMSLPGDRKRAPEGMQAVTISTHTVIQHWWQLIDQDRQAYEAEKAKYTERVLQAAEIAIPGLRNAIRLTLSGTPVSFEFFTRRPGGMVGGFPQTSLFQARSPWTGIENTWLVGDSIFPGQSTAAVTIGGMRVAHSVIEAIKKKLACHN